MALKKATVSALILCGCPGWQRLRRLQTTPDKRVSTLDFVNLFALRRFAVHAG